ncbi:MAG: DUF4012 domain-containing protein [Patescibacteria group bacterium]
MLVDQLKNLNSEPDGKKKIATALGRAVIGFIRVLPTFFVVLAISLVMAIVTVAVLLLPYFSSIKSIYTDTHAAVENLKLAQIELLNRDFTEAKAPLEQAKSRFERAQKTLAPLKNSYYSRIYYIDQQLLGIDDLLEIGIQISDSLIAANQLGLEFTDIIENQNLKFSQLSRADKHEILGALYDAGPQLEKIQSNLNIATTRLKDFNDRPMFALIKNAAQPIEENLPKFQPIFENIAVYGKALPELAGYQKQMNYLFLLQNNDELRPGGGFIGTYGVIQVKDADFVDFFTDNIYKLDRLAEGVLKVEPPKPVKEELKQNYWYMRDANWWHDFPRSAANVEWFYQAENGPIKQIDGVIAITQTFIESLISVTGPITVDGITFTRENFTDQLQFEVEKGYELAGIEEEQRKEIIRPLAEQIISKIMSLPRSEWLKLFDLIDQNIDEKQVLFYAKDKNLQSELSNIGWTGEAYMGDDDYLAVVDANLAALKTDSVMVRDYEYRLEEKNDGLYANVHLTYENLGLFTWKTTRYRTYNRIYVPAGSQLISYRQGGRLLDINKIEVFEELGKQVFGHFFMIEPKATETIDVAYKLPDKVAQQLREDEYQLVIQKQPGLDHAGLKVEMIFIKPISAVNENLEKFGQTVKSAGELREDMEFKVEF